MENWEKQFIEEFGLHFKDSPDELGFALAFIEEKLIDEYKRGYNDCLKERGLIGAKHQGLYL